MAIALERSDWQPCLYFCMFNNIPRYTVYLFYIFKYIEDLHRILSVRRKITVESRIFPLEQFYNFLKIIFMHHNDY